MGGSPGNLPRALCGALAAILLCTPTAAQERAAAGPGAKGPSVAGVPARLRAAAFEVNQGQTDKRVRFLARGSRHVLFLTQNEAVLALALPDQAKPPAGGPHRVQVPAAAPAAVLRMALVGASPRARVTATQRLPGRVGHYAGADPRAWRTDMPTFAMVRYQELYPGVELVYRLHGGRFGYDFILAPGADPGAIQLHFKGADKLALARNGDLVLALPGGRRLVHSAPRLYQKVGGRKQTVSGSFVLSGERVGFRVGRYDRKLPLIIDPEVELATLVGGTSGEFEETAVAVFEDATQTAVYVAGRTMSVDFPGSQLGNYVAGWDAYVARFAIAGTTATPQWTHYLGGSGTDIALDVAVDADGTVYVTGQTASGVEAGQPPPASFVPFPTVNAYQGTYGGGPSDVFLTRHSDSGSIQSSTYLGGDGADAAHGIAVVSGTGAAAGIYLGGETESGTFQTEVTPFRTYTAFGDGFAAKLDLDATGFQHFAYLGEACCGDAVKDIAVHDGATYVTGYTWSPDFPAVNPLQLCLNNTPLQSQQVCLQPFQGRPDAFVIKLSAAGDALLFSTLLGGNNFDLGEAITVDSQGNAYVTGRTQPGQAGVTATGINFGAVDFPTTAGAYKSVPESHEAFLAKIAFPETAPPFLAHSTLIGGPLEETGYDIAVDAAGAAYVAGRTRSGDGFADPALRFTDAHATGQFDAFVAALDENGAALTSWGLFGGTAGDEAKALALGSAGSLYLAGWTGSTDFWPPFPDAPPLGINNFLVVVGVPTPVVDAQLVLTKTDNPDPVAVGQTLVYELTVQNLGPADASNVVIADSLPAGLSFVPANSSAACVQSAPESVSCQVGNLAAGATAPPLTIAVIPAAPGEFTNVAEVTADQPGSDPGDNQVTQVTTVVAGQPVLAFFDGDDLRLYQLQDAALLLQQTFNQPFGAAFDRAGTRLTVLDADGAKVIDPASGTQIDLHAGVFVDAGFRPTDERDLALVAAVPGGGYRLAVRADTGFATEVDLWAGTPPGAQMSEPKIAWSPDGNRVLVAYAVANAFGGQELFLVELPVVNEDLVPPAPSDYLSLALPAEVLTVKDAGYASADLRAVATNVGIWTWGPGAFDLVQVHDLPIASADLSHAHLTGGAGAVIWGELDNLAAIADLAQPGSFPVAQGPPIGRTQVALSTTAQHVAVPVPAPELAGGQPVPTSVLLVRFYLAEARALQDQGQDLTGMQLLETELVIPAFEPQHPVFGTLPP